jgi:hypothetical protein
MDELFAAVFNGNAALTQTIIATNADLDVRIAKDKGNRTLLYSACRGLKANPTVVASLLQAGACFREPSTFTRSLPQHAIVQNYIDRLQNGEITQEFITRICKILKTLRDYFADFQLKNDAGFTALDEFERLRDKSSYADRIRSALKDSDFFTIVTSFEGCEEGVANESFSRCCEYLRSQPLPYLVNLNIAQYLWKTNKEEAGFIVNVAHTAIEKFCVNTVSLTFLSHTMEILLDTDPTQRIKLRIQKWPHECGGGGGSVLVNWEWLLGSEWRRIEDPEVLAKLTLRSRDIDHPPHSYKLDEGFVLRGEGPLDGTALRWLPCTDAEIHDDDMDSEDDALDPWAGEEEEGNGLTPMDVESESEDSAPAAVAAAPLVETLVATLTKGAAVAVQAAADAVQTAVDAVQAGPREVGLLDNAPSKPGQLLFHRARMCESPPSSLR